MSLKPTAQQQAVLDYHAEFFAKNKIWPSVRETQAHFGFKSTHAVTGHVRALVKKGLLVNSPLAASGGRSAARSVRVATSPAVLHGLTASRDRIASAGFTAEIEGDCVVIRLTPQEAERIAQAVA